MTYRLLTVSEWPQLQPEFDARSVPMPDPKLSSIYAAFDETGTLLAFLVCQFKLHTEPLVAYNPLAVPGLVAFAENNLLSRGFNNIECYLGATRERTKELARRLGFRPGEVMFVKRLGERVKANRSN